MNRRLYTRHQLLGSASLMLAECVVMMLLAAPVGMAQEPAATTEASGTLVNSAATTDSAGKLGDSAATATPAGDAEEPPATAEEPVAEAIPLKTEKTLRFSWDNTLKYSNSFRLSHLNPALVDPRRNPSNVNQDDGDRNFHGGLNSNRGDFFSEIDLTYGSWGVRASTAAWLDL